MKTNVLLKTLILLVISVSASAQTMQISTEEKIKKDVETAPCDSNLRLAKVKELFIANGAVGTDISTEKFKDGENLVVRKKGKTDEAVILGAHYDKLGKGCGAIDNWTGIVILANLYRTLSPTETEKTYVFVAFDKEEIGLLGSKAMVKTLPKENYAQVCSMINMDSFGFAVPQAATNMSSKKMIELAKTVSKEIKVPFAEAIIANADADSSSFLDKKIPAISFHGLNDKWTTYLHSERDKIENVNAHSVYLGYRFILAYLTKVDESSCQTFKKN